MNTEQERADLLPCPFCGSTNIEIQISTPDREGVPTNLMCSDCGASGPWEYEQVNSHAKADAAWNTRAALQSQAMDAEHWAELHRLRAERGPADGGYATWQEAAAAERRKRIEAERALQSQDRREWLNTLERKAEALWTAEVEDRHKAMRDLLHHASIGPQSQDKEDAERIQFMADEACTFNTWKQEDGSWRYRLEWDHGTEWQTEWFSTPEEAIDHARRIEG